MWGSKCYAKMTCTCGTDDPQTITITQTWTLTLNPNSNPNYIPNTNRNHNLSHNIVVLNRTDISLRVTIYKPKSTPRPTPSINPKPYPNPDANFSPITSTLTITYCIAVVNNFLLCIQCFLLVFSPIFKRLFSAFLSLRIFSRIFVSFHLLDAPFPTAQSIVVSFARYPNYKLYYFYSHLKRVKWRASRRRKIRYLDFK